jgi:DNA-binding response OmpR family regulator
MQASGEKRRVLIVDGEFAGVLSTRLAKSRPRYAVTTAYDGISALAKLRQDPPELLVVDIRIPGMSGIDLVLAALQLNASLQVIVLTTSKTSDVERLSGTSATHFLEKPFDFDRFLNLVDSSLAQRQQGFSGAISVQTLPDIVQLYVLSNATGVLTVGHDTREGKLWFDHGSIPHATTATNTGEEAFFEIMMWSGGEFSMQLGATCPEHSITANWQELLMESCRRIDERKHTEADQEPVATGWTLVPPPPPSEADPFRDLNVDEPLVVALVPSQEHNSKEKVMNVKDSLNKLNSIDGFVGAALVDGESGMLLGQEGGNGINMEIAAAGNTEVVKAKRKTMGNLGLKDGIEDILISLGKQYHMIRPLRGRPTLFFYVALDRQRSNLAMARIALADVEKELQV